MVPSMCGKKTLLNTCKMGQQTQRVLLNFSLARHSIGKDVLLSTHNLLLSFSHTAKTEAARRNLENP